MPQKLSENDRFSDDFVYFSLRVTPGYLLFRAFTSTSHDRTISRNFLNAHDWKMVGRATKTCDSLKDLCSFYALHSTSQKILIFVFRGTKGKSQLLLEGIHGTLAKDEWKTGTGHVRVT